MLPIGLFDSYALQSLGHSWGTGPDSSWENSKVIMRIDVRLEMKLYHV